MRMHGHELETLWHNKVDAKTFLKDDRKSPQGEEPAEKHTKATPPPAEEKKRGTREKGDPKARKRGREEAAATRRRVKEKLAAKVAEELRWRKNGTVEECWVHIGEELKGNRPLSKVTGARADRNPLDPKNYAQSTLFHTPSKGPNFTQTHPRPQRYDPTV